MTNMAAISCMVKALKHLLWNKWTDISETWHVASGTLVHHSCINHDLELTLAYFTTWEIW